MQFQEPKYLFFFLPISFLIYLLFRENKYHNIPLAVFSAAFYIYGSGADFIYLAAITLISYIAALLIKNIESERRRKLVLFATIAVSLTPLLALKYLDWIIATASKIGIYAGLWHGAPAERWNIILPAGISFFTFHAISYLIDTYRRRIPPTQSIAHYFTFMAFFPQLVAGPIARAEGLLTQLQHRRNLVSPEELRLAIVMIIWGCLKKLSIADGLAAIVDNTYTVDSTQPGAVIIASLGFTFQIYADFSAYTDIAIGSALLFGIRLNKNFNLPYFAVNPSDFWRRWHISLSEWLRDYVYIPLGGGLRGKWISMRNVFITMLLGGVWHGAGFFFILWGTYHAALIILYRLLPIDLYARRLCGELGGRIISTAIMFGFTIFGWLLFRSDSSTFPQLINTLAGLRNEPSSPWFWLQLSAITKLALIIIVTDTIAFISKISFPEWCCRLPQYAFTCAIIVMIYIISFGAVTGHYAFIYFNF